MAKAMLLGHPPNGDSSGKGNAKPAVESAKPSDAPEHHPDDLVSWEIVNDPASTPEERKIVLGMILIGKQVERPNN